MTKYFNESSRRSSACLCAIAVVRASFSALLAFVLPFGVLVCSDALAGTLYVSANNLNLVPPYTDWSTAATNIQDAVDMANAGDEIMVTNGVYKFGGQLSKSGLTTNRVALIKPVTVKSVNGPALTRIEGVSELGGNDFMRCVYVGTNAILSGFTLTKGNTQPGESGGGVWCESSAFVSNCVLIANWAGLAGGGAYGGKLSHCFFYSNSTIWGGGVWSATLSNCVLFANTAGEVGGGAGQCSLYNCTVIGNLSGEYGGGVWDSAVYNSIVYQNKGCADCGNSDNYNPYSYGSFDYSCTWPLPSRGIGNISSDPLFVALESGNLRLQSNSPCINAGSNTYATSDTDMDGRPRISGAAVDMGAYEFQPGVSGEFLGWLQQFALPADGSVDTIDSDGDERNNWEEWRAGTDPTNAVSVLRLFAPLRLGSNLVVSWPSVTNRTYVLQQSGRLGGQQQFLPLAAGLIGESGMTSFILTNAMDSNFLFYRIGVE